MWSDFWHFNDDTTYGKKQNSWAPEIGPLPGGAGAQVKWALPSSIRLERKSSLLPHNMIGILFSDTSYFLENTGCFIVEYNL